LIILRQHPGDPWLEGIWDRSLGLDTETEDPRRNGERRQEHKEAVMADLSGANFILRA